MAHSQRAPQVLFDLFSPKHWAETYRVVFTDGDDYELNGVLAGQDEESEPHGDGMVIVCHRGVVAPPNALFFWLRDVREVRDLAAGKVLYHAA